MKSRLPAPASPVLAPTSRQRRLPSAAPWAAPALIVIACLALSACQRDSAQPADARAATPQVAVEPAPAQAPTVIPSGAGAEAAGALDARAFAGRFEGTLPCAGCPEVDSILELGADGTYVLTETYPDAMAQSGATRGTWAGEDDGARIRLDPDDKREPDRLYEVASADELRQLDTSGGTIPTQVSYSLQRADAAE